MASKSNNLKATKHIMEKQILTNIIANIPTPIVITDGDYKIIAGNPIFLELADRTLEEIIGKPITTIIKNNLRNIDQTQPTTMLEYVAKSGVTKAFETRVVSTPIAGNQTVYLFIIMHMTDNTAEKATEFISLTAHQLATPLGTMRWFIQSVLDDNENNLKPTQIDALQEVLATSEKMIKLVKLLLNISRVESGRITINPKPTDLSHFLQPIFEEQSIVAATKHQKFATYIDPSIPNVTLDSELIYHVYLNLISNAIKYTPTNGEIEVTVEHEDKDFIITRVKDTGFGIPPEDHANMFQKFYRAKNILQRDTEGSGLGLYFVKVIVEVCGGKIWFDSTENVGTTFYFTLPIKGITPKTGTVSVS